MLSSGPIYISFFELFRLDEDTFNATYAVEFAVVYDIISLLDFIDDTFELNSALFENTCGISFWVNKYGRLTESPM